jgi:TMEM175 potassium channel family protein
VVTEKQPPGLSETTRIEAFSDGVFAIAITLLVLEIHIPSAETGRTSGLVMALRELWPSYLGYVISFVTIGIMWANHHSIFSLVRRSDRYFMLINVAFLMGISFLPFPTAVLAEYLPEPEQRQTAVAFYSATLVVIALLFNVLWRYAIRGGHLLEPNADRKAMGVISQRYVLGPFVYALSFGLAFVNVWASLAVHGALAIVFLLPERHVTPGKSAPSKSA